MRKGCTSHIVRIALHSTVVLLKGHMVPWIPESPDTFTFYCSSIKGYIYPFPTANLHFTLHSTVVLLKVNNIELTEIKPISLHSTVVLLKVIISPSLCLLQLTPLHSTVVLLKALSFNRQPPLHIFTFYCSSIKGKKVQRCPGPGKPLYILL